MNDSGETKRVNEAIQDTFSRIEEALPGKAGIGDLIAHVLQELQEAFNIPFAWFSIIDHPETTGWQEEFLRSPFLRGRLNRIDSAAFAELATKGTEPVLANGDLKPFYRLLPQSNKYFIRSIAMAPITMHGVFIGSLNFGDTAPTRYHAEMDTSLLAHLASAVSNNLADRRKGNENT
jgi:uncharacterized protein YigA (DUF484 family)